MPLFIVNYRVESEPGLSDTSRLMRSTYATPFTLLHLMFGRHILFFIYYLLLVTTHEVIYLFVDSLGGRRRWVEGGDNLVLFIVREG